MAIATIDLRRDLPKVREQWDAIKTHRYCRRYSAPCAVGAMLSADARSEILRLDADGDAVRRLVNSGVLSVPYNQVADLCLLQRTFDRPSNDRFEAVLAELEAKYLTPGDK